MLYLVYVIFNTSILPLQIEQETFQFSRIFYGKSWFLRKVKH